jgi:hypothetical protein
MKFMLLIYNEATMLDPVPGAETDALLRDCFAHVDDLHEEGHLIESQMLESPRTAKSVRIRNGRVKAVDGPFAETKEMLGGFNLIEARDMDEAVKIAAQFPWAKTGCVEVRPVRDLSEVRRRVGAAETRAADTTR